jgi:hypothetical protein
MKRIDSTNREVEMRFKGLVLDDGELAHMVDSNIDFSGEYHEELMNLQHSFNEYMEDRQKKNPGVCGTLEISVK